MFHPAHNMREYGGVYIWLHSFLTSALDKDQLFTSVPVALLRKRTRYPLHRRLGGPQNRSQRFRADKSLFFSVGIQTSKIPACSLIAVPTILCQFSITLSRICGHSTLTKIQDSKQTICKHLPCRIPPQ